MLTVNTAGKSAKAAADLTAEALKKFANQNEQEIQVIVEDTMSAFEIQKILEKFGLSVSIQDDDGRMTLTGSVKTAAAKVQDRQEPLQETAPVQPEKLFEPEQQAPVQPQNLFKPEPETAPVQAEPEKLFKPEPVQSKPEILFKPEPEQPVKPQKLFEPERDKLEQAEREFFERDNIKVEEDFRNSSAIADKATESKEIQELNLKVKQAIADKEAGAKHEAGGVFVIMGRTLGRGDDKLGGILIKGFLAGLARSEPAPDSIILLNGGVKLALFDSSTCDHLKDLEARGTQILISGVCTSHFGITDSIGAGVIANIYEIVDVINKAVKVVCL
ncbi:MAG: hypothetical protein IJ667_07540 [Synergistaceae bacterium]|nr:hypothetical protein [Synergistaceae bacterium]